MARRACDQSSKNVAKFIYEDVICRHGCPQRIVLDRGSENLDLTKDLLEHYKIKRTVVSAYHPQANGLVECGHDSVINFTSEILKHEEWVKYLPLVLTADRVSVRRSTGYSAFELVYERDCWRREFYRTVVCIESAISIDVREHHNILRLIVMKL